MTSPTLTQGEIIQRYKQLQSECSQFVTKISELEVERNEHDLVIKTLTPLDKDRRAFRLVGGVLVERTVGEVLPSVLENRANLNTVLENLTKMLETKNADTAAWKKEHSIMSEEEAKQARAAMERA
jgi:prefoldin subunit 2